MAENNEGKMAANEATEIAAEANNEIAIIDERTIRDKICRFAH